MARNYAQAMSARTGIAAVDTAVPAAPEDSTNVVTNPLPTGVWSTQGADKLKIDVVGPSGATGNYQLAVYAWNRVARQWVLETVPAATPYAEPSGGITSRLLSRTTLTNWCSDFVAVLVTSLGTGGGSGVGTSVYMTACVQDK
jgi:hypothetical protein